VSPFYKLFLFVYLIIYSFDAMADEIKNKNINVYGEELKPCCYDPLTGYFRDGYCRTIKEDVGTHVICSEVTDEFLQFTLSRGNNLIQPSPQYNFPGLKDGDKWCLCALRWKEAYENGVAPPIDLDATDIKTLDYMSLDKLEEFSVDNQEIDLSKYEWKNRVILLFANDRNNKQLKNQLEALYQSPEDNLDRDIKIFKILESNKSYSELNDRFEINKDFEFILIGKDGTEKLKSDEPVSAQELYSLIDSMPMRQREMEK
jgi:uncharacterized protein (DUF2237 family)